jgi:N-acetylglucosaminyldiphosphoundecaprenol N-acetyl-beta-D-mannosaminyltransferase
MSIKTQTLHLMNYNIFTGDILDIFSLNNKIAISTTNINSYYVATKDAEFMTALKQSDILLPDGIGIVLSALILKGRIIKQISGPQIHPILLRELNDKKGSCFYLGSTNNTLGLIETRLHKEYPNIRVGFYSPPFKDFFSEDDNRQMINAVNTFNPDMLFVGMTAPKQEKWAFANKDVLNAKIICSIGAVFDFYAGTIKEPHPIYFKLGLVWLVRLIMEPRRLWKRDIKAIPNFFWNLLLFRIGLK